MDAVSTNDNNILVGDEVDLLKSIQETHPRKNTLKATSYGKRAVSDWWEATKSTIPFDQIKFPDQELVASIRASNAEDAFFLMSHVQRAHFLRFFVAGVQPRAGEGTLTGKTIKGMIDSWVRYIKGIEAESESLSEYYGDWSWTKSSYFKSVKEALKSYTMNRFSQLAANPTIPTATKTADALRLFAFEEIHNRTLMLAGCSESFRSYALHLQKAGCQVIGGFCGNRAISEMHEIKISDFVEHGPNWMEYKPTGVTKSTKVNAEFEVTTKLSSFIVGRKNCDVIRFLASHRSLDAPDRLFLKVRNNVAGSDEVWFANQNVGVNTIGKAVSEYASELVTAQKIPEGHYTNTSMRKLVVDRLASAGCPELLVASAIGHYVNNSSSQSAAFSHKNMSNYLTGVKDSLTRRKIAMLLHNKTLRWEQVEDDATFFQCCVVGDELIDKRDLPTYIEGLCLKV